MQLCARRWSKLTVSVPSKAYHIPGIVVELYGCLGVTSFGYRTICCWDECSELQPDDALGEHEGKE